VDNVCTGESRLKVAILVTRAEDSEIENLAARQKPAARLCNAMWLGASISASRAVVGDSETEIEVVVEVIPDFPTSLAEVVSVEYDDARLHAAP
jgi:hypothetical protein